MRLIGRYIFREFLGPLVCCLLGFIAIYVLFDLSGQFSRIAEAKLPFPVIVKYFAGYLAPYFRYLAPAALMLATLYTVWNLCRHSEITAMRANGISFFAIGRPILLVSVVIAGLVAWVDESFMPEYTPWARQLRYAQFKVVRPAVDKAAKSKHDAADLDGASKILYENAKTGRVWSIGRVDDPSGCHLENVAVNFLSATGGGRLLTAERADYLDGEWWFTNPKVRLLDGTETLIETGPTLRNFNFRERPDDILSGYRGDSASARGKLRELRNNGDLDEEDRRELSYKAWDQIFAPLACVIITLFSIPAGVASGRQSVFLGILSAMGAYLAFYIVSFGCWGIAVKGWLPPVVAAIAPSVVFFAFGGYAYYRQR